MKIDLKMMVWIDVLDEVVVDFDEKLFDYGNFNHNHLMKKKLTVF